MPGLATAGHAGPHRTWAYRDKGQFLNSSVLGTEKRKAESSQGNSLFRGCAGKQGVGQEGKGRWWGAWHLLVPSKQLWAIADEDMQPRAGGLCLCDCLGHPKSACHHHSGSPTSHVLTKRRPHGPAGAICSLGHLPRTRAQHIMILHLMSINLSPGAP